jgi:hypothetical protein
VRPMLALLTLVVVWFGAARSAEAVVITRINTVDGFSDSDSGFNRSITFLATDFTDSSIIADLNVSIHFTKADSNMFVPEGSPTPVGIPDFDEIGFELSSPSGTSVVLIGNGNGTGTVKSFGIGSQGFQGTIVFDQSAPLFVNQVLTDIAAGTFKPANPPSGHSLDEFVGESAIGTFSLRIQDGGFGGGLSFYDYSLTIETQAVPEPSSVALLGVASLIGYCYRRHHQHRT